MPPLRALVLDNFERSLCDGFRPFHTAVPAEIAIRNKKLLNYFGNALFSRKKINKTILKEHFCVQTNILYVTIDTKKTVLK